MGGGGTPSSKAHAGGGYRVSRRLLSHRHSCVLLAGLLPGGRGVYGSGRLSRCTTRWLDADGVSDGASGHALVQRESSSVRVAKGAVAVAAEWGIRRR